MEKLDYHIQLKVNTTPAAAIKAISNVAGWWAQEVTGRAQAPGDQVTVHFGNTWGSFRVAELGAGHVIWEVTDCYLDLLKDTKEWQGTRIIFQLGSAGDQTIIDITHEGLTPARECFNDCTNGWNFYFGESLYNYLENEQGLPGAGIHAWLESDGMIFKGKIYTPDQPATEMSGDLLLLDVQQTRVEQVVSAYSVRSFNGEVGQLQGDYYMLLNNEPGLLEHLQNFVRQSKIKAQSYSATLQVSWSPEDVFALVNDVPKWWTKDFSGQSTRLHDEFIINPDCGHYSKHKLVELIPNQKVVWLVTDSKLDWVEGDQHEWTHTKMVFEISPKGEMTELKFTHEGLVPGQACYTNCAEGWDMFIKGSLYRLMQESSVRSSA